MCSAGDSAHQGVERKIHRFPAVVTAFMLPIGLGAIQFHEIQRQNNRLSPPCGNSRSTSHILNEDRRFPYDKCKMSRLPGNQAKSSGRKANRTGIGNSDIQSRSRRKDAFMNQYTPAPIYHESQQKSLNAPKIPPVTLCLFYTMEQSYHKVKAGGGFSGLLFSSRHKPQLKPGEKPLYAVPRPGTQRQVVPMTVLFPQPPVTLYSLR